MHEINSCSNATQDLYISAIIIAQLAQQLHVFPDLIGYSPVHSWLYIMMLIVVVRTLNKAAGLLDDVRHLTINTQHRDTNIQNFQMIEGEGEKKKRSSVFLAVSSR